MEPISAFRGVAEQVSLSNHLFGMAVDVDPTSQFYISANVLAKEKPGSDGSPRDWLNEVLPRAEALLERVGTNPDWRWPTARLPDSKKVLAINANLVRYFSLIIVNQETDDAIFAALRDTTRPPNRVWDGIVDNAIDLVLREAPPPDDPNLEVRELMVEGARQVIHSDMQTLLARAAKDNAKWESLKRVMATRGISGFHEDFLTISEEYLVWMAEDGDLMHFDTRKKGVGLRIKNAIASFKGNVGRLRTLANTWAFGVPVDTDGNVRIGRKVTLPEITARMDTLFDGTYPRQEQP